MSISMNKAILGGYAGRDPEVRHTPNGAMVVTLSLASSRSWRDKTTSERVSETEWHRLVAYDRVAEFAANYVKKGSALLVEGRLKTRKYTDSAGVERSVTEIIVSDLQLADRRESGGDADSGAEESESRAQRPQRAGGAPARPPGSSANPGGRSTARREVPEADDIPFATLVETHEATRQRGAAIRSRAVR
jgi:single-strand DNA-binding protein